MVLQLRKIFPVLSGARRNRNYIQPNSFENKEFLGKRDDCSHGINNLQPGGQTDVSFQNEKAHWSVV